MQSNFNFKLFVCFCRLASVLSPPKNVFKFFLGHHNGNKATQLFCVIPCHRTSYIYIYIYNFTLQFSFWLVFYLGKLCKFLIYWGYFCDGKRYLVTYKPNTIGQTYKSITYVRINQRDLKLSANVMFINFILEGCICSV